MAANDYFPDLPDTGDVLESAFQREGWDYTRIDNKGVKVHKQLNFGKNMEPGSPNFGEDMIYQEDKYYPNKPIKMTETKTKKEDKVELPELDEITPVTITSPRDLCVLSIPKMGKGTIFGDFTHKYKAIVLDLEKSGYEYIPARKLSIYTSQETSQLEAYQNYIKYRKALLEQKGKYEYLIIDGLSDLDDLSHIGGTFAYMDSIMGKKFNREGNVETGRKYTPNDPEWRSVVSLPDGAGYYHLRNWFLQQIEFFRQISPYRIYAAHVVDKYIKDNGKDQVIGSEINLTGKLKLIFSSKITALAKMVAEGDSRYLSFDVLNDSIIAGSRSPLLTGRILISSKGKDNKVETFWEKIYGNSSK